MSKNNGGPAFPHPQRNADEYPGMSLRDAFAIAALPTVTLEVGDFGWQEKAAWNAYSLADAMLREREKPKEAP